MTTVKRMMEQHSWSLRLLLRPVSGAWVYRPFPSLPFVASWLGLPSGLSLCGPLFLVIEKMEMWKDTVWQLSLAMPLVMAALSLSLLTLMGLWVDIWMGASSFMLGALFSPPLFAGGSFGCWKYSDINCWK